MNKEWPGKIIRSPLFIIILLVCAANWQLFFCVKTLQWDIMNFWYPWRYFIAECYTNGLIPLWDPYTQAGYPVHGDLQGPAYNPETIISSFLFNGSLYYLNYLFIGYLVLGAYGFYKLCILFYQLVNTKNGNDGYHSGIGALTAGILYALSGYNTGYGHYLYITVSVCLIPWMYYYVIKILNNGTYTDSCKLAVFVFMQVTAGNPSFLIVSGYFFLVIVALQFFEWFKKKQKDKIVLAFKQYSVSGILIILLCLPVLVNAYYVFPETTRGNGIQLAWAAEERFALRNFLTFFTPLISLEREYQSGLNQPIFDYYIGLTTLFFAVIGFIKYRCYWIYVFTGIAIISFLLSIGLRTPVFGWFHGYLPFFNVFRMPRLIFLYCQVFILLMASLGITYFLSNKINIKWFMAFFVFCFISGAVSLFYFKFFYKETGSYIADHSSLRYYLWSESQFNKALLSFGISAFALVTALLLYRLGKRRLLIAVLIAEGMLNYSLGAIARNFSDTDASVTNSYASNLPAGFACPENISTKKVTSLTGHFNEFWLNACIFIKQPGFSNDNNFELTNYMKLYYGEQPPLNYFTSRTLAFLADSVVTKIDNTAAKSVKKLVLVDSLDYSKYKNLQFFRSPGDTIIFKKFEPQHFLFEVHSKAAVGFVLQQNLTKLWHVYLDGAEIKPGLCFYSFPFIKLDAGTHTIEFSYQVPRYRLYFVLSLLAFFISMLFILFRFRNKWFSLTVFILIVVFCSFKFYNGSKHKEAENINELQQKILNEAESKEKSLFVMNTRDVYYASIDNSFSKFNFIYPEDVASFINKLGTYHGDYLYYSTYKTYGPPEVEAIIKVNFGKLIKKEKNTFGFTSVYKRDPQKQFILFEKNFNIPVTNPDGLEIKKGKEFSPTFEFKIADCKASKYDLIFAEAEIECSFDDFKGLCLSIDNNGKNKRFLAYNFVHHPGLQKQRLSFYYRFREETKPTDVLKVFVWNDDERPLLLLDFKLKVISKDVF